MAQTDVKDISKSQREKNRRRDMHKLLGLASLFVIVLGLYASRDRWLSKVSTDSILLMKQDEITGENFPLSVSNNTGYQTCRFGEGFAVLSDTKLYIYSGDGKIIETRENTYSNSVMKNVENKALIYEQGGSYFRVEGKRDTVYNKKASGTILTAEISNQGYVAVVSLTDRYVCELSVYDAGGEEIYFRGCKERIIDIAFNSESTGCAVVNIDAQNGSLVSKTRMINFKKSEDLWESQTMEVCCVDSYMLDDNGIFIFGDEICAHYDADGNCDFTQSYTGTLSDFAYSGNKAAIVCENEVKRETTMMFINGYDQDVISIVLNEPVKCMYAEKNAVYIMTEGSVDAYDYSGKLLKSKEISEVYRQIYRIDDYIMLIGYNSIDRVKFELKLK